MEQQMHKQFYCPMDKCKTMFVKHATKKGLWICSSCRYQTSNPKENPKMPKTNTMYNYYKTMKEKSCENKFEGGI